MRLGLLIVFCIFAAVLYFADPVKAPAQSCAGSGCSGTASSVGCAGSAGKPVRGVVRRVLRPLQRIRAVRGCS